MKKNWVIFGCGVIYQLFFSFLDKNLDIKIDPIRRKSIDVVEDKYYDYVFLGDSHAALWQSKSENQIILGISGQSSEQIRLRSDMLSQKLKGKKLIISLGDNDIACLSTNPTRAKEIENLVLENLGKILQNHTANFKEIYILTIAPRTYWNWVERLFHYDLKLQTKHNINIKIIDFAKTNDIKVLDVADYFQKNSNSGDLSIDGAHFSEKTYKYLNDKIQ